MGNEAYRNQSWSQRFGQLGDQAEGVYLQTRPLGATTEWGFHRPNGIAVSKLPPNLAHTPDFVTATHGVEVVGLGRDGILKGIKVEKWEALKVWQKLSKILGLSGGIVFFVWNSAAKEFVVVAFTAMSKLVKRSVDEFGIQRFEVDKVEYYPIPYEWLRPVAVWVGEHDASRVAEIRRRGADGMPAPLVGGSSTGPWARACFGNSLDTRRTSKAARG